MPNNECIAYFDPGDDISAHVEAAVTGRRFVKITDPKQVASQALANDTLGGNIVVSPCNAVTDRPFGVASYDASAGQKVPVIRGHKVVPVEAGGAATAGDPAGTDALGRAIPAGANPIAGTFLNSPTAAGQTAIVALNI